MTFLQALPNLIVRFAFAFSTLHFAVFIFSFISEIITASAYGVILCVAVPVIT